MCRFEAFGCGRTLAMGQRQARLPVAPAGGDVLVALFHFMSLWSADMIQKNMDVEIMTIAYYYYIFSTNLYLITHNHSIGRSNTNTVPACAVF